MGGMLEEEEYEKLATMPDVNQEMVGLFIQYCDEYAKYFTDIKEYCFKKCIEGYKIKKKRFGLSDEDERNKRKINEDLRLLKKAKGTPELHKTISHPCTVKQCRGAFEVTIFNKYIDKPQKTMLYFHR